MKSSIALEGNRLAVRTPYNPGIVAEFKRVDPRARWDADRKAWLFPPEPMATRSLLSLLGMSREQLAPEVRSILGSETVERPSLDPSRRGELAGAWPSETKPYDHQILGLDLLLKNDRYALFWEMGCGKSAPTSVRVALGLKRGEMKKVLIVCPKSALQVWPHELALHGGIDRSRVGVATGDRFKRHTKYHTFDIVVTNFEVARIDEAELCRAKFDTVIIDECHRIKSIPSKTSKAIRRIARSAPYRYALSGTPAPNSPIDVCGTLIFLDGGKALGTEYVTAIKARYCLTGGYNQYQVVGYKNLDELERITSTLSHRIKKEECLDLPAKIYESRSVELSAEQHRIYRELKKDAVARIDAARGEGTLTVANILTESMRLLQVCGGFVPDDDKKVHALKNNPKLDTLLDLLEDIGNVQAIIWANFVAEVNAIATKIDGSAEWTPEARCVVHHGGLSTANRTRAIDLFKAGDVQFLISTPQSLREAVTLTNASTVVYYSRGWNLLDWSQSQDRAHRIGQDKPVTIISLVATGTVDERISEALEKKLSLQELVVGGGNLL